MHVRIGQIAQTLGVSTHLLKHYEKIGLIRPVKDETSKYRYYDIKQCKQIVECKKYRMMGITLKEITEIFEGKNQLGVRKITEDQIDHIEKEMRDLNFMKQVTVKYYERCCEFDERLDQWFVELSPWLYFLPMSDDKAIIEWNNTKNMQVQLIDTVPLSQQMYYVKAGHIVQWGLCIEKKDLEQWNYPVEEQYVELKPQKMLTVYMKIEYDSNMEQEIRNQVERICPSLTEPWMEAYILHIKTEYENEQEYYYLKVYITIKDACSPLVFRG